MAGIIYKVYRERRDRIRVGNKLTAAELGCQVILVNRSVCPGDFDRIEERKSTDALENSTEHGSVRHS